MKKLNVLNITFKSKIRTIKQEQQVDQPLNTFDAKNQACEEMLQILSMRGLQKVKVFKESLNQTKLNYLTDVLKKFHKFQSNKNNVKKKKEIIRMRENYNKIQATQKRQESSKNEDENTQQLFKVLNYMRTEIQNKNRIIQQQQTQLAFFRSNKKYLCEKIKRKAMEDINILCKGQLQKMIVDAKSCVKRDTRSATQGKKIIKRQKFKFQKPNTVDNKQNWTNFGIKNNFIVNKKDQEIQNNQSHQDQIERHHKLPLRSSSGTSSNIQIRKHNI